MKSFLIILVAHLFFSPLIGSDNSFNVRAIASQTWSGMRLQWPLNSPISLAGGALIAAFIVYKEITSRIQVAKSKEKIVDLLLPYVCCNKNTNPFAGPKFECDQLLKIAACDKEIIKLLPARLADDYIPSYHNEITKQRVEYLQKNCWELAGTKFSTVAGFKILQHQNAQVLKIMLPTLLAPYAKQMSEAERAKNISTRNQVETAAVEGDRLEVDHQWQLNPEDWNKKWINTGLLQLIETRPLVPVPLLQLLAGDASVKITKHVGAWACEYVYQKSRIWEWSKLRAVQSQFQFSPLKIKPFEFICMMKADTVMNEDEIYHCVDAFFESETFKMAESGDGAVYFNRNANTEGFTELQTELKICFTKENGCLKKYELNRGTTVTQYPESSPEVQRVNEGLVKKYCFNISKTQYMAQNAQENSVESKVALVKTVNVPWYRRFRSFFNWFRLSSLKMT